MHCTKKWPNSTHVQQLSDSLSAPNIYQTVIDAMAAKSDKSSKSTGRKAGAQGKSETRIIKKYANRRLYDTRLSQYVTLDDLAEMVRDGEDLQVVDAKTGEDLTRSVLAQIIFEAEAKGANMLPTNFLRDIIGFYGDRLETVLPDYLEHTMAAFSSHQDQLRDQVKSMGTVFGIQQWEDIGERNMAMFERAAEMFSPFGSRPAGAEARGASDRRSPEQTDDEAAEAPRQNEQLDALKSQLDALQRQLDGLTGDGDGDGSGD